MKKMAVYGKYSEYRLSKLDEQYGNEETSPIVTVRIASPDDNLARYNTMHQHFFNPDKLKMEEIFLTLTSSNLMEGTSPLFKFNEDGHQSRKEFSKSFDNLWPELIDEIHECVLDANPSWAKEWEAINEIEEYRSQALGILYVLYSRVQSFEPEAEVNINLCLQIDEDEVVYNFPR